MSFDANDGRYEIDANGGRDMGAVERTVDFAHALQHDDPLAGPTRVRSEEHTSELQSQSNLVCRLLLEKKKKIIVRPSSITFLNNVLTEINTLRQHVTDMI